MTLEVMAMDGHSYDLGRWLWPCGLGALMGWSAFAAAISQMNASPEAGSTVLVAPYKPDKCS